MKTAPDDLCADDELEDPDAKMELPVREVHTLLWLVGSLMFGQPDMALAIVLASSCGLLHAALHGKPDRLTYLKEILDPISEAIATGSTDSEAVHSQKLTAAVQFSATMIANMAPEAIMVIVERIGKAGMIAEQDIVEQARKALSTLLSKKKSTQH